MLQKKLFLPFTYQNHCRMKGLLYSVFSLLSLTVTAQETQPVSFKKAPLTEEQQQRWSHLDLEKDSIPGMSVDKAYSELLKEKKGLKWL